MFLLVILVGLIVASIVSAVNYCVSQLRKFKDINKLPGPSALEIIKKVFGGTTVFEKYQYAVSLNKKYGPVVKLWIKPFDPIIMVADTEFFGKILISKEHLTKSKMYNLLKPYIGEGIATTNKIDMWKRDRRMCNMAFQSSTVTGFLDLFTKHTDKFLELLKQQTGKVVDTQSITHLYTLDVVFESIAKETQNFQGNKNPMYLNARIDYFRVLTERLYSNLLANDLFFKFSKHFHVMVKALHIIKNFTSNIIRSEQLRREEDDFKNSKLHIIDILFENKVQGDALNYHINTFILAAHDTMAQSMCFTLYELSRNPDVKLKLFEEITSIVGNDKNAKITNDDLNKMKYLECVVKESLRLHTIVPVIERKLGEDLNIRGIKYPKGTIFSLQLGAVHESEEYFKNANKFDPDRFMPENAHLIQRNSYAPFSLGPRDCIGKLYAMLEVRFFIAKVIQKFEVYAVENHELKILNEIIVKSLSGIPVIFKERI